MGRAGISIPEAKIFKVVKLEAFDNAVPKSGIVSPVRVSPPNYKVKVSKAQLA